MLPNSGKGLGKGIREFKKASKELTGELESSFKDEPVTTPVKQKTEA